MDGVDFTFLNMNNKRDVIMNVPKKHCHLATINKRALNFVNAIRISFV